MTQYGHAGQHHGRGTPDCPTDLHHHHDERCVSPLDERRQRAREAGHDVVAQLRDPYAMIQPMEAAIETATRARITDEVLANARTGLESRIDMYVSHEAVSEVLSAALRELGFEVEQ